MRVPRVFLACLAVALLSGCGDVALRVGKSKVPELHMPDRPTLDTPTQAEIDTYKNAVAAQTPEGKLIEKLKKNLENMVLYGSQLEIILKDYNAWARTNNRLVNTELGVPNAPEIAPAPKGGN